MSTPPLTCIVCSSVPEQTRLNDLPVYRCPTCGLFWRQTFDVPISYYEEYSPNGSPEQRETRLRNARDRVRTLFAGVPRTGVCDVGTGDGAFLEALALEGGSGVGIEPSKEGREEAQKRGVVIVGEVLEDITKVPADARQTITLFHVIEHVERPDEMLKLFSSVLPRGGRLIIETPTMDSPVLRAKGYKDQLVYPEHLYYFTEHNLTLLLERAGFIVRAHGRRDYDQYRLPIRESLRRLLVPAGTPQQVQPMVEQGLRARLRGWLARRVMSSGRINYQWVVAQKQ
jgi:SAM-dependent methyltransferase